MFFGNSPITQRKLNLVLGGGAALLILATTVLWFTGNDRPPKANTLGAQSTQKK